MKTKTINTFLIVLFLSVISSIAIAVPAYNQLIIVKQSDNKELSLFLKGDEKVSWAKTIDGYTLLKAKNGDFVYAITNDKGGISPSTIIAHNENERNKEELEFLISIDKHLLFSQDQINNLKQLWEFKQSPEYQQAYVQAKTTERQLRIVVLLVGYPNRAFTYDAQYFDDLFNQVGYNINGNEGCVKDYFLASTFGNVAVTADVFGPFISSAGCEAYSYEVNSHFGAKNLLTEAIGLADSSINFANYCSNGSQYVDCVYMIYAGCATSSGEPNSIWPHRGVLYPAVQKDGVYIYSYACSAELNGTTASGPTPPVIGTICHEFSHVLGLDDVYDTDYGESGGEASSSYDWDVMSSGCYNNGAKTPSLWSAFQRNSEGYLDLIELSVTTTGIGNKTLPPLHIANTAYKLTLSPTEYFVLENRQKTGWDRFLPGHGMIITHIDKGVPGWDSNCANCDPTWMGIDIKEANPSTIYNRGSNPFPGTSNNTSFTDTSNPSSLSNSGVSLNRPITRIKENTNTQNISFDFGAISTNAPRAITNEILRITSDSIYVSVSVFQSTDPIVEKGIVYSTSSNPLFTDTKVINSESVNDFTSVITGVLPSTTYFVRAYVKNSSSAYFLGEIIQVTTPCISFKTFPFSDSFESDNTLTCWSEESTSFLSNVWKIKDSTISGGISMAQDGSKFFYLSSTYPTAQTRKLIAPQMDISVLSQPYLKFYYATKERAGYQDALRVYYKTSKLSQWQLLKTYFSNTTSWTMDSIALPNKSNTYYIAFEAELYSGYGVCIDNVLVSEADLMAYPVVDTLKIDNITDNSARITSKILGQGYTLITERGVVYSKNPYPTIEDFFIASSTQGIGQYIINPSNLESNTEYYFRAYAKNQGLISYGEQKSILTKCERVNTFPHSFISENIDSNCFDKGLNWQLTSLDGGVNPYSGSNFFMFKPIENTSSKLIIPIINLLNHVDTKIKFRYHKPVSNNSLIVYYKTGIEGQWNVLKTYTSSTNDWTLDSIDLPNPNDNYYISFEGISENSNPIYIDEIEVNGIYQLPIVNTSQTSLLTYNSIQTGGEVVYLGTSAVVERGVCWTTNGTVPQPTDSKIVLGSGMGSFSTNINNLQAETTYRIRAYAKNSYGTGFGQEYIITTPAIPIFNNTISGNQSLCFNSPTQTLEGSNPTGGNNEYSYLWIQSSDDQNWDLAEDSDLRILQSYLPFRAQESFYYKRIVYSRLVVDTSNSVLIRVSPRTKAGNVFRAQDTITLNQELRMELRAFVADSFIWERKKLEYDWVPIANADEDNWLTDTPTEVGLYYYRVRVKSGECQEEISGIDWTYVKKSIGLDDDIEVSDNSIIISPNPSSGEINVIYNNQEVFVGDLSLFDINAKQIKKIDKQVLNQGDNRINLNPIEAGSYLIVFKNKNQVMSKIIIINR
ncbi:MAG: M6 family metalloprotease domain-containing protein [Bacteroidales bacterium]|nr:M6 family metalloprotease domain-containing protein [Bacteroidales bacterium]